MTNTEQKYIINEKKGKILENLLIDKSFQEEGVIIRKWEGEANTKDLNLENNQEENLEQEEENEEENDIILDPCCGSASHCLCAKELNRKFVGIELDEKYFKIGKQRFI